MEKNDWPFFIVFQGGLVCYLVLHNVLVPILGMMGNSQTSFFSIQWAFIPQLLLLYSIIKKRLEMGRVLILYTHFFFVLGLIHLIILGKLLGPHKILFTYSITLISLFFFLLGYHVKFSPLIPYKGEKAKRAIAGALLLTVIHLAYNFVSFEKIIEKGQLLKKDTEKTLSPTPILDWAERKDFHDLQDQFLPENLQKNAIKKTRFLLGGIEQVEKIIYSQGNKDWTLQNACPKNLHVRVEYFDGHRWIFKKLLVLKAHSSQYYEWFKGDPKGIYRIFSPTNTLWKKQLVYYNYEN